MWHEEGVKGDESEEGGGDYQKDVRELRLDGGRARLPECGRKARGDAVELDGEGERGRRNLRCQSVVRVEKVVGKVRRFGMLSGGKQGVGDAKESQVRK